MTSKRVLLALALVSLPMLASAAGEAASHEPEPVATFYRDAEHCAYMMSPPEKESAEFMSRFERDIGAAVQALQVLDPSLTLTQALFRLRAGCDRALAHAKGN